MGSDDQLHQPHHTTRPPDFSGFKLLWFTLQERHSFFLYVVCISLLVGTLTCGLNQP